MAEGEIETPQSLHFPELFGRRYHNLAAMHIFKCNDKTRYPFSCDKGEVTSSKRSGGMQSLLSKQILLVDWFGLFLATITYAKKSSTSLLSLRTCTATMSSFKLTKDEIGLLEYDNDKLTVQRGTQYSDRASKQLAEDVFAKNRAEYEFSRGKAPESESEGKKATEELRVSKERARRSRWSVADVPPEQQNTLFAPFIKTYYDSGSPSLRDYINRSYLPWKQFLGIDRDAMEVKLKAILDRVEQQGTIDYVEWSALPLPQDMTHREKMRAETGLMVEDLFACASARQMQEMRGDAKENLKEARRQEQGVEELREVLGRKGNAEE